jgi:hypothetical protein
MILLRPDVEQLLLSCDPDELDAAGHMGAVGGPCDASAACLCAATPPDY